MADIQARISHILHQISNKIYDKHTEISLALLTALSGESILLLGPPGVAKSMIARRLKDAFSEARSFEYLMSRFSTPDEIFGPVSISKLKANDKFERAVDGFLPTADVVFLDEIWKAGPAIQNTLLTVMNEKLFRNGDQELHLPLKLLVAASNELPTKGEGLEALWDRFLVRIVSRCIGDEAVFRTMLCDEEEPGAEDEDVPVDGITAHEYAEWQNEAKRVHITQPVLEAITFIRQKLRAADIAGSDLKRDIYVSDRRWKHIAALLRTSAYVQGRHEVWTADLLPIYHCLWNEPEEIATVRNIVFDAVFASADENLQRIALRVKSDLQACDAQKALSKALRENDHRDENLCIVDWFFYQIENHGTGHSFVFIADFKQLPEHKPQITPVGGVIYEDVTCKGRQIVRVLTPEVELSLRGTKVEHVTLCRNDTHIFINGVAFSMRNLGNAVLNPAEGRIATHSSVSRSASTARPVSSATYEDEIEKCCEDIELVKERANANLFASEADKRVVQELTEKLYRRVALCRVDIRKLLYNDE